MKKGKIICFFCDIMGTINGNQKNNDIDYENFAEILIKIKEKSSVDKIIFSLISSDLPQLVMDEKQILSRYLDSPIEFGYQFFINGFIDLDDKSIIQGNIGKVYQIIEYCKYLGEFYDIQSIYFADDCKMYQEMLSDILSEYKSNDRLISIVPKNNRGLCELNEMLDKKIKVTGTTINSKILLLQSKKY